MSRRISRKQLFLHILIGNETWEKIGIMVVIRLLDVVVKVSRLVNEGVEVYYGITEPSLKATVGGAR